MNDIERSSYEEALKKIQTVKTIESIFAKTILILILCVALCGTVIGIRVGYIWSESQRTGIERLEKELKCTSKLSEAKKNHAAIDACFE